METENRRVSFQKTKSIKYDLSRKLDLNIRYSSSEFATKSGFEFECGTVSANELSPVLKSAYRDLDVDTANYIAYQRANLSGFQSSVDIRLRYLSNQIYESEMLMIRDIRETFAVTSGVLMIKMDNYWHFIRPDYNIPLYYYAMSSGGRIVKSTTLAKLIKAERVTFNDLGCKYWSPDLKPESQNQETPDFPQNPNFENRSRSSSESASDQDLEHELEKMRLDQTAYLADIFDQIDLED